MKTIYIGKNPPEHNKLLLGIGFLVVLLICIRLAAPLAFKSYINRSGADNKGYSYKVDDVAFKILKGQVMVSAFHVFKANSETNFMEAKELVFDLDPLKVFSTHKVFSVKANSIDVLVSKDLFEEVNRIKNESKNKTDKNLYLEKVTVDVGTINVRQLRDQKPESILTLKDAHALLKDFGVGSINENTEFNVRSGILEGGKIQVSGKTKLEANNTPWQISGDMKQIPAAVLEKLAGDKLPIEITSANVNAAITAHSHGGQIEGVIEPDIKDLKLAENEKDGFLKRNIAKATNFLMDKAKDKDKEVSFKLPFILNQNFSVNIPKTIEKIRK
jgi:hypothetical protein